MASILLIDDEESLRENVGLVLEHAGYGVRTASNGREGLGMIVSSPPDLVVCDVSMPEMGGLEMAAKLRSEQPDLADLPFIFLSAFSDRDTVMAGKEAGADEYLVKPVDYDLLRATISNRLERARQAAALKEKQFVRLFKSLTTATPEPPPSDDGAEALRRLAGLKNVSLAGRVSVILLEEIMVGWDGFPRSIQDKVVAVFERLLATHRTETDIQIRLGEAGWLVVMVAGDLDKARASLASLRDGMIAAVGALNEAADKAGPVETESGDGAGDGVNFRILIDTLNRQEQLHHGGGAGFEARKELFRIDYTPIWNCQTQVVDAYKLCIRRRQRDAWGRDGRILFGGADDPWLCDVQRHVLDTATRDIMTARADSPVHGKPPLAMIPLSLRSLTHLEAFKVERQLEDMTRLVGAAEIGFLLSDLDEQMPIGQLRHIMSLLTTLSATIACKMNFQHPQYEHIRDLGCRFVQANLDVLLSIGFGREIVSRMIGEFLKTTARFGMGAWMCGVDTVADARLCVAGGMHLMCGKVIGDIHPTLGVRYKLPQSKVYLIS